MGRRSQSERKGTRKRRRPPPPPARPPEMAKTVEDVDGVLGASQTRRKFGKRTTNYTEAEDVALVKAWEGVKLTGNNQTGKGYWQRIADRFHGSMPEPSPRSLRSLRSRCDVIKQSCSRWSGCLEQVRNDPPSGCTVDGYDCIAQERYKHMAASKGKEFVFQHCWKLLEHSEKWKLMVLEGPPSKKRRSKSPANDLDDDDDIDDDDDCEGTPAPTVNIERPDEMRKEKDSLKLMDQEGPPRKKGRSNSLATDLDDDNDDDDDDNDIDDDGGGEGTAAPTVSIGRPDEMRKEKDSLKLMDQEGPPRKKGRSNSLATDLDDDNDDDDDGNDVDDGGGGEGTAAPTVNIGRPDEMRKEKDSLKLMDQEGPPRKKGRSNSPATDLDDDNDDDDNDNDVDDDGGGEGTLAPPRNIWIPDGRRKRKYNLKKTEIENMREKIDELNKQQDEMTTWQQIREIEDKKMAQEKRKMDLEERRLLLEENKLWHKIMMMDPNGMDETTRAWWDIKRGEILQSTLWAAGMRSGGSASGGGGSGGVA